MNLWAGGVKHRGPLMQNFRYRNAQEMNCAKCAVGIGKFIMSLYLRVMNTIQGLEWCCKSNITYCILCFQASSGPRGWNEKHS